MQPFDLEKALAGAKLVTRDGREVITFSVNPNSGDHLYHAYRFSLSDSNIESSCSAEGKYRNPIPHPRDLFLADEVQPPLLKAGDWIPCVVAIGKPNTVGSFSPGLWYHVSNVPNWPHESPVWDAPICLCGNNSDEIQTYELRFITYHFDITRKCDYDPRGTWPVEHTSSILEEAQKLIYGDRQADYGSVTTNFTNIAKGWEVILGVPVTPEQVGLAMAWVKIARQCNRPKRDNLVDVAGYIGCIDKMEKGE